MSLIQAGLCSGRALVPAAVFVGPGFSLGRGQDFALLAKSWPLIPVEFTARIQACIQACIQARIQSPRTEYKHQGRRTPQHSLR